MRYWLIIFYFFIIFISVFFQNCSLGDFFPPQEIPRVFFGEISIDGNLIQKYKKIKLDGEWEFYWNRFLSDSHSGSSIPDTFAKVPGVWNDIHVNDHDLSGYGYASYLLKIHFKNRPDFLAIYTNDVSSSHRIFWNGQIVSKSGVVSNSRENYSPSYNSPIGIVQDIRELNYLLIEVANYEHRKAGLWESIEIGTPESIQKSKQNNLLLQMFIFGSLFIIGLYHLSLSTHNRSDFTPLYFALFCLFISVHPLFVQSKLFFEIFPDANWKISLRIHYTCLYLASISFAFFIYTLYPNDTNKLMIFGFSGFIAALTLMVLLLPVYYFTFTLIPFEFAVLIIVFYILFIYWESFTRGKKLGLIGILGFIALLATIINDILHSNLFITTTYTLNFGILTFVFTHSYQLSIRYSKSIKKMNSFFQKSQKINHSLNEKITELKLKLEEKTKQNINLTEKLESILNFNTNVFRISFPKLKSIINILENLHKSELKDRKQKIQIKRIMEKSQSLQKICNELSEYFQNYKVNFPKEKIFLNNFIKDSINSFTSELNALQVEIILEIPETLVLHVDKETFKRVFAKLTQNSLESFEKSPTEKNMISISAITKGSIVVITFEDNGEGIPGHLQDTIFSAFTSFGKVDSTGLGLTLVKEIIVSHNGRIYLDPEKTNRAKFIIELPIINHE